jgi:hypothetical protein
MKILVGTFLGVKLESKGRFRLRLFQVLLLCQMLCIFSFAASKKLKLYDGPDRPASELVTILVNGDSFVLNLHIHINGKWQRVHSGTQVLPGTYDLYVLSMCGHPAQFPPANPPVPTYAFFDFHDPFTAAAGDTVTYVFAGVHAPIFSLGKKGHESALVPGTTCYGAWGAFHTVTRAGALEPDDVHNTGGVDSPAAVAVMRYLEAEGRGDQSAANALLAANCKGDLAGRFQRDRDKGWRFSASNTQVLHDAVPQGNAAAMDAKLRQELQPPQDATAKSSKWKNNLLIDDGLVAQVGFRITPGDFRNSYVIFHLTQENGVWKITNIADWFDPDTPAK